MAQHELLRDLRWLRSLYLTACFRSTDQVAISIQLLGSVNDIFEAQKGIRQLEGPEQQLSKKKKKKKKSLYARYQTAL